MTNRLLQISWALGGLLALVAVPAGTAAHAQDRTPAGYAVTDLGTLGGANSFAYSINRAGQVTGGANTTGQNDPIAQTAFLWAGGRLINLGTLGGSACVPACSSEGAAASASGTVAFLSETANLDPDGEDFCEFGTHRQCLAVLWRGGARTVLPTLGGRNAEAFFINSLGEAVGVSETETPDDACLTPSQVHQFKAVKWSPALEPTALEPLAGDTVSFAFTNNDRGETVGFSGLCSNVTLPPFLPPSAPHAVMWDVNDVAHDLGNPRDGAGDNVAVGINDHGQITVNSVMNDGTIHAFVSSGGALQDLGTYPSDAFLTFAPCCNNINNAGQIVGSSLDSQFNQRVLLWRNKDAAPIDLNTLLPEGSPWYLVVPAGINDAGAIAATAVNIQTNEIHAVLVSPIHGPAPAARGAAPLTLPESVRATLRSQPRR